MTLCGVKALHYMKHLVVMEGKAMCSGKCNHVGAEYVTEGKCPSQPL